MANKTISDLLEKTTVADSDIIWVQNASTDNKVTKANLLKEVNNNLNLKANTTHTHTKSQITDLSLSNVATTGSYNDLTNKPTIPVVTNDLTNTLKSNYDAAYTHSTSSHAPTTAQKNSDITKAEIESKLTGEITSHTHPNMGGSGSDSVIPLFKETTSANENEIYIAQSGVAEFTVDSNKVTVAGDGTMTIADETVTKSATFTITKNGMFILDVSTSTTGFYYISTRINGISLNGGWTKVANKYEYTVNANDSITINFDNASRNYTFKGFGENKNELMWKANNEIVNLSMGEQNVQSDWNATDSLSDSYIKNKPYVTDNLTSTSATNVLSARQGKILDDKITQNTSSLADITKQQPTDLSLNGTILKLKKADGTEIGVGISLPSGGNVDLSDLNLEIQEQTLSIKNGSTIISSVNLPNANISDEQIRNVIQQMINDGTLSSILLGDNSVDYNNTTFMRKIYKNIFIDIENGVVGNMGVTSNASYRASDYIKCNPTDSFTIKNCTQQVAFYTGTKTFIKSVSQNCPKVITIPENAYYFRVSCALASVTIAQVHEGTYNFEYSTYNNEFLVGSNDFKFNEFIGNACKSEFENGNILIKNYIKDGELTANKLDILKEHHINLVDIDKRIKNSTINSTNGSIEYATIFSVIDFIEIDNTKTYFSNTGVAIYCYDKDKVFLGASVRDAYRITFLSGTKYCRLTVTEATCSNVQLTESKYEIFNNSQPRPYSFYVPEFKDEIIKGYFQNYILDLVRPLYNKKVGHVGDSFSAVDGFSDDACKSLGATLYKKAVSGATISTHNQTNNMISFLDNLPSDLDYLTLMGGTNDANASVPIGTLVESTEINNFDDTTFIGALQKFFVKALTKYPYVRMGIMYNAGAGLSNKTTTNYLEAMIKVANYYRIPYCDMINSLGFSQRVEAQGIFFENGINGGHPTSEGQKMIARKYKRFLESL